MGLRIRLLGAALSAAALLSTMAFTALPANAVASTWRSAALAGGPIDAHLYGVSCASAATCVAVGGNSTIAASTDPNGGAAAWSVFRPAGGIEGTEGIPPGSSYGGGQLRGVSCPSPGLCAAASLDGRIFSSANPLGGSSAWKVVPLSEPKKPNIHMFGISCPTVSFCVAVGYGGNVVVSTDPTGDRPSWQVTKLPQPYDFRAVSCPSPALCVAVSLEGDIVASTDPAGGPGAWVSAGRPAGEEPLGGVACPSPSLCVAGNAEQLFTSTDPAGGAGAWTGVRAGTGIPISGVSCPSTNACAAIDTNSDVSTDPLGGPSAWSFKNVIPFNEGREGAVNGNGMFAISCPSSGLCVGAGSSYQVISSADPFAPDTSARPVRKRLKRPRVVITAHPPKRIDNRRGGVRVAFRFRAIGRRAAYFKCKVRGKRFRRCKSPSRYRIRGGAHVFRVRAIAPGGVKGPATAWHFRVGALSEPAPAGSCRSSARHSRDHRATASRRGCINGDA
jgi:hypothetical protein